MVELCTHLAIERARLVTSHLKLARLISIPTGTRELVLTPLPYIVVYRIADDVIHILRILHRAQKWP
jgi:toxin ParE1/3/4